MLLLADFFNFLKSIILRLNGLLIIIVLVINKFNYSRILDTLFPIRIRIYFITIITMEASHVKSYFRFLIKLRAFTFLLVSNSNLKGLNLVKFYIIPFQSSSIVIGSSFSIILLVMAPL